MAGQAAQWALSGMSWVRSSLSSPNLTEEGLRPYPKTGFLPSARAASEWFSDKLLQHSLQ